MTDILSQEEIDALLRGGATEEAPKEKEEKRAPPPQQSSPQPPQQEMSSPAFGQQGIGQKTKYRRSPIVDEQVEIQSAVFDSFEEEPPEITTDMNVVLDLDLEIRVELGKTTRTVREVLELGAGSVIELNRFNGEPVDLLVNKKYFAKGEMIVITGENFGVRVTDISSVKEIIEALK